MARADLLVALVRAANSGDRSAFVSTLEALIAEERAKHHHRLAEELASCLAEPPQASLPSSTSFPSDLLVEVAPDRKLSDLVLRGTTSSTLDELVAEHHRADLLRSYGLEPRHRLLLVGQPGNGKTSVTECLAGELSVPLYTVRYEGVIGSYLGETTARLQRVFEHVRPRNCVLLFDEFDTIGKERGDEHETGEIKRVVSSLLLQMDHLPSRVVVVAATNHPELLDRAAWRRFELRIDLPPPTRAQIAELLSGFAAQHGIDLGRSPRTLADHLLGTSFAEIEGFAVSLLRRYVLALPDADMRAIADAQLAEIAERVEAPGGA
jgi:SpoVK/Ycf46/Vps4 family AAA+-type ATPase